MANDIERRDVFGIEFQVNEKEEILWRGQPSKLNTISALESNSTYDLAHGPVNRFGSIVGFTIAFGMYFYMIGSWRWLIYTILAGIIMLVMPEVFKESRRKVTEYLITPERIIFKLWYLGKTSFHFVEVSNIRNLLISENENELITIYIICKDHSKLDFHTHDFKDGSIRQQPTLELLKEGESVKNLINSLSKS